jgi:hypothetical protein
METDPQITLLTERIERLAEAMETMNEKLDRLFDPENGVYAKGQALENRVETLEKQVDKFTSRAWWLVGAVVVQVLASAREWIAHLFR